VTVAAALRRLATLVARGEPPEAVFAAAAREALRHFGSGTARMIRYELDGTVTLLTNEGLTVPDARVGDRWEGYPPTGLTATVRRTGRAARIDDIRDLPGGEPLSPRGSAVRGRHADPRQRAAVGSDGRRVYAGAAVGSRLGRLRAVRGGTHAGTGE
jgi:hypothetical protein